MLCEENKLRLPAAVKNQYIYKLRAHSNYFCALVLAQLIAALLSLGGTMTCYGSGNITTHVFYALVAVIFTGSWAVIISILLTTRQSKNESFALPNSRLTDCLSDIAFLLTGCVFGGITVVLLGVSMRTLVYFIYVGRVIANGFYPTLSNTCVIAVSTMLYMLLLSTVGYLAGVLVRCYKVFYVIIPALLVGVICLVKISPKSQTFFKICFDNIIKEKSLGIFALKVLIISVIVLAIGTVVSNRAEVRK